MSIIKAHIVGKWNLAQSIDSTNANSPVTHSDISLQDPNYSSGAHTHSAPTFTSGHVGGSISSHIASPVLTSSVPIAGAQVSTSVPHATQPMTSPVTQSHPVVSPAAPGAPIANAHVANATAIPPGAHAIGTPITFAAQGTPIAQGTSHVAPGAHFVASPTTGAQSSASGFTTGAQAISHHMTVATHSAGPIAGAPLSAADTTPIAQDPNAQFVAAPPSAGAQTMASAFTPGTQATAPPMVSASQIVTTPALPVSQVMAIPVESGETSKSLRNPLQKIMIDIFQSKQDSDYIKYRWDAQKEMDIFYAKEGFIINEIQMNGTRKWPAENDVKVCKKVLYYTNPSNGKKTLKVLYDDEAEAYDPDFPPEKSTDPNQPSPDPNLSMPALTKEADGLSLTSGTASSPVIIPQSQSTLPPAHVTTQHTLTPSTPISNDPSHTSGLSNEVIYYKAEITSVQSFPATPGSQVAHQASISTESPDSTGWTTPLELDQAPQESNEDQTPMDSNDSGILSAAAHIDHSAQNTSPPQPIQSSSSGLRFTDIKLDPDDLDDEQPHHGFHVEEVRGFDPDDDDDDDEYERVPLTEYVTDLGYRVGHLENRMDSTEDTLKLLIKTVDYQHDLLEFRRRFGVKTAPFGADFGRHSFYDPEAFKPATSLVSKVLDASEHPSDIKLFVLGADSKLAELTHDKFKVKQEGEEIHYDFQMDVECKLVTFKDRTVWHHRDNDPHPLGVVFHPDYEKVVVDFDDAIVMFVKKGESAGSSPVYIDPTEEVDSGLAEVDSTTIASEIIDSASLQSQSSE